MKRISSLLLGVILLFGCNPTNQSEKPMPLTGESKNSSVKKQLETPDKFVVYTVRAPETYEDGYVSEAYMEPMVIVENGKLIDPVPPYEYDENAPYDDYMEKLKRASEIYLDKNKTYTVLLDGGAVGTAKVEDVNYEIMLGSTVTLSFKDFSETLGLDVPAFTESRESRPLSNREKQQLKKLIHAQFKKNKVSEKAFENLETDGVRLTQLDNGTMKAVGQVKSSLTRKEKDMTDYEYEVQEMYYLFFIADLETDSIEFVEFGKDPGFDDSATYKEFLGQLDIDGDGIDEIFARQVGYEWHSYVIYKKKGNKWVQVYEGAGGGV